MLSYIHKFIKLKNAYQEMLSSLLDSTRIVTTTGWYSFIRLSNDQFEILPVNDLLPKTQFYEINRSYQLRNIFVPILIFGLEDEFDRIIRLLSEAGLAKKFKIQPGHVKYLVCSFERVDSYAVNDFKSWEDPFTYTSHKSACVSCSVSRKASAYILRKDYAEFIHRDSSNEETLRKMKETGLYDRQKIKYLNILSKIQSTSQVIATTYWPSFSRDETPFEILSIQALLQADNYPFLLNNIFVPIIAFNLHSELGRVVTLLKEIGLAKKFELKPGYYKYLVKESDVTSNRYTDPVLFLYGDRGARFEFSEGPSITVLLKDYDEYFLRRKNAEIFLWGLQNYTCQYCGRSAEHIDHVVPLSKGGSCTNDNLALACRECNLRKHDNTPEEAKMSLVKNFPEFDENWAISSERYFQTEVASPRLVQIRPNRQKKCYEITLLDEISGEIISEHFAETKSEAFWKFIELYESINPNYTFNPFGRVDSAMRDGRDVSLQAEDEELKANIAPLKAKLKNYIKRPDKFFPVLDVYSNLIQEIAFSEKPDLNVFCCSLCKQRGVPLADVAFYFYTKSPQEHFDLLNTVICESCSKGFTEKKKIKMGQYWVDIVVGNKWHTLELFVKKRIGVLRGNSIGNLCYRLSKGDMEPFESELEALAEYVCLLDICRTQGFKVSPWRPRYKCNIVEFVNALPETLR